MGRHIFSESYDQKLSDFYWGDQKIWLEKIENLFSYNDLLQHEKIDRTFWAQTFSTQSLPGPNFFKLSVPGGLRIFWAFASLLILKETFMIGHHCHILTLHVAPTLWCSPIKGDDISRHLQTHQFFRAQRPWGGWWVVPTLENNVSWWEKVSLVFCPSLINPSTWKIYIILHIQEIFKVFFYLLVAQSLCEE